MAIVNVTKKDLDETPSKNYFDGDEDYLPEVTTTERTPHNGILAHIEGSSWNVTYYQQELGLDSSVKAFDPDIPDNLQPYIKIRDFELKVSSELSLNEADGFNVISLSGSANVYPVLVPNKGDLFLADTNEGYEGVFSVTSVERLTHLQDTVYSIEYQLIARDDTSFKRTLDKRSLKELYFKKDLFQRGLDPFLIKEEIEVRDGLDAAVMRLTHYYMSRFFSKEYSTFLLPDKGELIYDPFITKVFTKLFNVNELPQLRHVKTLNTENLQGVRDKTIWDALLMRDKYLLETLSYDSRLIAAKRVRGNPLLSSATHMGIDYIVTTIPTFNVDDLYSGEYTFSTYHFQPESRYKHLGKLQTDFSNVDTDDGSSRPLTPLLKEITGYVFNKPFYEGDYVDTQLEILARQHIERKSIDLKVLDKLSKEALKFSYGEAFYYIPILLIFLKSAIISGRR